MLINIPLNQIQPDRPGVLETQGMPRDAVVPPRVKNLYDEAVDCFKQKVAPAAIQKRITQSEFENLYKGLGNNEKVTPLETIFPRAQQLFMFALTLGPAISDEIEKQLNGGGFALGYMLDAVASYCADKAVRVLEKYQHENLQKDSPSLPLRVLAYSPGYCGWHISGQSTLFRFLNPNQIGIHLTERFLMSPLKSVSGVLVAGPPNIHLFRNNYPFCAQCKARNCRERMDLDVD